MKRDQITGFKVKFNILDYVDILPDHPENYEDIINWDKPASESVWKRTEPKEITPEYIEQEITRILRTGVWIFINKQPIWLPPNYYFFLQYFKVGGEYPEFRLSRLKAVYFHIRVRNNPFAIGTFTIKSRQIGETSFEMSNSLHEAAEGNLSYGSIGIQSKTNYTVKESCWRILTGGWQSIPRWLKDVLYSDIKSEDAIATKLAWIKPATETEAERDVLIIYGSSTDNSFDSLNNMRFCLLDEVLKWRENSFYATFLNYKKFIAPGKSRRGLFKIFSSPADFECNSSKEGLLFWKQSDPKDLDENGTTKSRVFRYYASPLEGLQDMYDEFGDADADEIYEWIIKERNSVPKEKQLGEVRAYPLNEDEMFGSTEGGQFWSNVKGINERKIFLIGARFKDEKTQEPIRVFGNLHWKDGIKDSDVVFSLSDKTDYDVNDARFSFSFLPPDQEPLTNIFNPPHYIENCIGIDSVDKRYAGKSPSDFAMTNYKFRDIQQTGIVKCPTMVYCNRPMPIEVAYEDAIKACVFLRAMAQVESLNTKIVDYFEDRGYINWMLSKIGKPRNSLDKGDAPSGGKSTAFIDEIIGMVDSNTSLPYETGDLYPLTLHYHLDLLEDITAFNKKDTHSSDRFMSFGQSLLGSAKIMFKKERAHSEFNEFALDYLLN